MSSLESRARGSAKRQFIDLVTIEGVPTKWATDQKTLTFGAAGIFGREFRPQQTHMGTETIWRCFGTLVGKMPKLSTNCTK